MQKNPQESLFQIQIAAREIWSLRSGRGREAHTIGSASAILRQDPLEKLTSEDIRMSFSWFFQILSVSGQGHHSCPESELGGEMEG